MQASFYKTICILGLFLFCSSLFAQSNQLHIHLDKGYYTSGELVQMNLYLPPSFKDNDFLIKSLLLDEKGHLIDYTFLKTEGQLSCASYFKLGFDMPSAIYNLRFQVYDKVHKSVVDLGTIHIPIYNDLLPIPENLILSKPNFKSIKNANIALELELKKQDFRQRELIELYCTNTELAAANWSVSVTKQGDDSGFQNFFSLTMPDGFANWDKQVFLEGNILHPDGFPMQANILGVYSTVDNKMFFTKSDALGATTIRLPTFDGTKPIQIFSYEEQHDSLVFVPRNQYPVLHTPPLVYTQTVLDYLEASHELKKINQIYQKEKFALSVQKNLVELLAFKPDASYDMSKYEPFKDMQEFFREHLTPLRFKQEKEKAGFPYYASMYNPEKANTNKYFEGKPLFIIDGKISRDGDFVAHLDFELIEQVDLYFNPKKLHRYFNLMGKNGVIVIQSWDKNLPIPKQDTQNRIQLKGKMPLLLAPHFKPEKTPSTIPFFTPQIFWLCQKNTTNTTRFPIQFYHSDDKGNFQIEIVLQNEKGEISRKKVSYSVK